MAKLVEDTEGVHQVFLTEEHPWLGVELTTYHILVDDIITSDDDLVDGGLGPFGHSHLEGYGVALDIGLDRVDASEDIAVVVVEIAYSIFVDGQAIL